MKVPLKIKIFLLFLKKGVILTKDNLAKRNWNGSKTCCFCSKPETIHHLFSKCHYAQFNSYVMLCLFCLAFNLHGIQIIFLVVGRNWMVANIIIFYWLRQQHFAEQFGSQEMTWCLTKFNQKPFCRFFSGGHIGSDFGLYYSARMKTKNGFARHVGY